MADQQNPANPQGQNGSKNPPPGNPFGASQGGFGGDPYGNPFGGFAPGGGAPPPPPTPEDTTPANYVIGQSLPEVMNVTIPAHTLKFDEQHFLHLLAGSISLTRDEKKRIIDSIPRLKQSQIDELIRIFEEEKRKFAELSGKHVEQLKKLEKQHLSEWQDLELAQKAESKKGEDEAKADEIRKKLGL